MLLFDASVQSVLLWVFLEYIFWIAKTSLCNKAFSLSFFFLQIKKQHCCWGVLIMVLTKITWVSRLKDMFHITSARLNCLLKCIFRIHHYCLHQTWEEYLVIQAASCVPKSLWNQEYHQNLSTYPENYISNLLITNSVFQVLCYVVYKNCHTNNVIDWLTPPPY